MPDNKTIAVVAYPGLTLLDLVGPLQVFTAFTPHSPRHRVVVVSRDPGAMPTDAGVAITADHRLDDVAHPGFVVVPGGGAPTMAALADRTLLDWLREAGRTAELMTSVCTGSLILGAAGLLQGRRATTHWSAIELLAEFGAVPVRRRWVADGPVLTAAGVSAGIDMALHLVSRLAGDATSRAVQLAIEYDPQPPLGPIGWEGVDTRQWAPALAATLRKALADEPELAERLAARL